MFGVPFEGPEQPEHSPVIPSEEKQEMIRLTELAKGEGWKNVGTLLRIRDECSVGKEVYRYPPDQICYFYPASGETKKDVLKRILARNE